MTIFKLGQHRQVSRLHISTKLATYYVGATHLEVVLIEFGLYYRPLYYRHEVILTIREVEE